MTDSGITRRDMLGLLAGCVIVGCSRDGIGVDSQAAELENVLLRMVRHLYPHDALADDIYMDALASLLSALADDASLADSFERGSASLDAAAGRDWLGSGTEQQIAALQSIENEDFFRTVQDSVRIELYNHRAVWDLIGFEGSSVEFGGYIDRGFDDIDWLPED